MKIRVRIWEAMKIKNKFLHPSDKILLSTNLKKMELLQTFFEAIPLKKKGYPSTLLYLIQQSAWVGFFSFDSNLASKTLPAVTYITSTQLPT